MTWGFLIPTYVSITFISINKIGKTQIIKYFLMLELGICIKLESCVEHIFYAWLFSHNTAMPVLFKKDKYYISLNKCNTTIIMDCKRETKAGKLSKTCNQNQRYEHYIKFTHVTHRLYTIIYYINIRKHQGHHRYKIKNNVIYQQDQED